MLRYYLFYFVTLRTTSFRSVVIGTYVFLYECDTVMYLLWIGYVHMCIAVLQYKNPACFLNFFRVCSDGLSVLTFWRKVGNGCSDVVEICKIVNDLSALWFWMWTAVVARGMVEMLELNRWWPIHQSVFWFWMKTVVIAQGMVEMMELNRWWSMAQFLWFWMRTAVVAPARWRSWSAGAVVLRLQWPARSCGLLWGRRWPWSFRRTAFQCTFERHDRKASSHKAAAEWAWHRKRDMTTPMMMMPERVLTPDMTATKPVLTILHWSRFSERAIVRG